jgi:hypothetical protein
VHKQAQKQSFLPCFTAFCPPFTPFQHAFFTNRLSKPFRIPFSCKPSRRGVYGSARKLTVSGGVYPLSGARSKDRQPDAKAPGCTRVRTAGAPAPEGRGSGLNCQRATPVYGITRNQRKRVGATERLGDLETLRLGAPRTPINTTAIGGCHPAKAILRLGARPVAPWAGCPAPYCFAGPPLAGSHIRFSLFPALLSK